ncbi:CAP domain-containing protein [Salimicrobium salexigens]|uniref:Cysteine-rich secretory protein family protein n=1 Tax=Salimicrobium salexigens TaxID=908941 RepID=A0ABY1KTV6_9BACI|nr:CAP domain-containing protein [Salimicrobium salexigens]SIS68903.1 Cysteine-rich secretory protein family protein [Salimicrobium salexigens]
MKKAVALLALLFLGTWVITTLDSEWDTVKKEMDSFMEKFENWETGQVIDSAPVSPEEEEKKVTSGKESSATAGEQTVQSIYGTPWMLTGTTSGNFSFANKDSTGRYLGKEGESYDGITIGQESSTAEKAWGEPADAVRRGMTSVRSPAENYDVYQRNNKEVTVFYDRHEGNVIKSIYIVPQSVTVNMNSYYANEQDWVGKDQAEVMFGLINRDRTARGLEPLSWREELVPVAEAHSTDMTERDYFSHTNPGGQGPADRAREAGVSFRIIGENLAYGQSNAVYAHEGLMDSKGHRDNILNPAYEEVGIGVAVDDKGAPYFTVLFYKG